MIIAPRVMVFSSIKLVMLVVGLVYVFNGPNSYGAVENKQTIKIAIVDWCPQICPDQADPGYISEIAHRIFSIGPYTLELYVFPWSRGIMSVRSGKMHALLAPTKKEAPNLLFPKHEIGTQKMCFFHRSNNNWRFSGVESLQGMRIGIVNDVYIKELAQYQADNPDQFHISSYYDGSYIDRSLKMLTADRLDTFIFTYNSTQLHIQNSGLTEKIKAAGCFEHTKVYMAFSPAKHLSDDMTVLMNFYDSGIERLLNEGLIQRILSRYRIADWRNE
jgi:polar amino acid transport system substrate-binding protein